MGILILATILFISFGATAILIPGLRRLALQKGWVDQPDGTRKLHETPTPTAGGLAIFVGFVAGMGYLIGVTDLLPVDVSLPPLGFWLGALLMVGVGFYDDTRKLNFKQKLFFQVIAAYLLLHEGYRFNLAEFSFLNGDPYTESLYTIPLTLLWIVGIINAVNLIDGLDGLAGGVVMIGFVFFAVIFGLHGDITYLVLGIAMVGAIAGFLLHNFNPASIFMGDSGSMLLGFTLATYSLKGQVHADPLLSILVPAVALGLPVVDANLSILRRLMDGRAISAPDKDHIHHRLALRFKTRHAVLLLYAVAAVFGSFAVLIVVAPPHIGFMLLLAAIILTFAGIRVLGYIRIRPILYTFQQHPALQQRFQWLEGAMRNFWSLATRHVRMPGRAAELAYAETEGGHAAYTKSLLQGDGYSSSFSSGDGEAEERIPIVTAKRRELDMVTEDSVIVASDQISTAQIGGEAVLLDLNSGKYYGLNEVGAFVFKRLHEPVAVSAIFSDLLNEYGESVDADILNRDILAFLRHMETQGLIRIEEESGTAEVS